MKKSKSFVVTAAYLINPKEKGHKLAEHGGTNAGYVYKRALRII